MIYSEFINKTKDYLKSVRILKDHVSFDLIFKKTWVLTKDSRKGVEIIKEGEFDNNNIVISFVSKINDSDIEILEETVDKIIRFNIEREEKEKLFKSKVDELKSIFAKKQLEDLKNLKFDTVDGIENLFDNDGLGDTKGDSETKEREEEKPTEHTE